jgi:hypothetical protein
MKISEEFYNDLMYLIDTKVELMIANSFRRDNLVEYLQFSSTEKEFMDNYIEKRNENEVK